MGQYVYKNPLEQGYKQFKLTKKQHNKLFTKRQIKWNDKYEYYFNDQGVVLQRYGNWKAIIVVTILFPGYLLLEGLSNYKQLVKEYKEMFNQKQYGVFTSDYIWSGTDNYDEVMKNIGKEGDK